MKQRVISAVIALMIFIPIIYFGGIVFKIAMCVLALLGMKEFLSLNKKSKRPVYVDVIVYALTLCLTFTTSSREVYYIIAVMLPLLLVVYCNNNKKYNADDAFKLIGMILLIGMVFNKVISIRNENIYLLVYLMITPMLTDTFAQLGGILIGKHKLAPKISPKKTWEGSITGAVLGTILASTFYFVAIDSTVSAIGLILVTLFLSTLGQLGDLVFSCVKRNYDIKDFSNIMPGHGGILDRLDSIIFVVMGYIILSGII